MTRSDSEWDQRILCSDGNCIGIIGADGRCKACGMPYDGQQPLPEPAAETTDDPTGSLPDDSQINEENDATGDDIDTGSEEPDGTWKNRTLCIDESCIGVVGPDGRCKECGKPYSR